MPLSKKIADMIHRASAIRRMFDEGNQLKAKIGAENVFDFTLGNPSGEPPAVVEEELLRLVREKKPGMHRYMPNAGFPDVRVKIAESLSREYGYPFTPNHVVMTVGAAGALNIIMKILVEPGEEIIILAPYFSEYLFYIDNHQAVTKIAQTDEKFQIDLDELDRAIGPSTRILLLNSPNNPTGAVYPAEALEKVGELLETRSNEYGKPIYLVMDEPYKKLVYDGVTVPNIFDAYRHILMATSHSKDMNIPGERIGYIAISPEEEDAGLFFEAMTMTSRVLGYVNAPALFQRLVAGLQDVRPDMSVYAANRSTLVEGLTQIGYNITAPEGGFYIFAKSPIKDDLLFIEILKKRNILVVPGAGFGRGGYFRIAYCCDTDTCRRALPGFAEAFAEAVNG